MKNKNPHKLTLNQHIFPVKSLQRFCDRNGNLMVYDKIKKRILDKIQPSNTFFGTKNGQRITTQLGENYGKKIEDSFQETIEKIIINPLITLDKIDLSRITDFFNLWCDRAELNKQLLAPNSIRNEDITKNFIDHNMPDEGSDEYNNLKNLTDKMDRENANTSVIFVANTNFGAAFGDLILALKEGDRIRQKAYNPDAGNINWRVKKLLENEVIIPDVPYYHIIPITPQLLLIDEDNPEYKELESNSSFDKIAQKMKAKSHHYYINSPIDNIE